MLDHHLGVLNFDLKLFTLGAESREEGEPGGVSGQSEGGVGHAVRGSQGPDCRRDRRGTEPSLRHLTSLHSRPLLQHPQVSPGNQPVVRVRVNLL